MRQLLANAHALADHRARFNARSRAQCARHRRPPRTAPTLTPSPSSTSAPITAVRMHSARRQRGLQQLGRPRKPQPRLLRFNHRHRRHSLRIVLDAPGLHHHRTRGARQAPRLADAASSANTRSVAVAALERIHTRQAPSPRCPAPACRPVVSTSSPSVMLPPPQYSPGSPAGRVFQRR